MLVVHVKLFCLNVVAAISADKDGANLAHNHTCKENPEVAHIQLVLSTHNKAYHICHKRPNQVPRSMAPSNPAARPLSCAVSSSLHSCSICWPTATGCTNSR